MFKDKKECCSTSRLYLSISTTLLIVRRIPAVEWEFFYSVSAGGVDFHVHVNSDSDVEKAVRFSCDLDRKSVSISCHFNLNIAAFKITGGEKIRIRSFIEV